MAARGGGKGCFKHAALRAPFLLVCRAPALHRAALLLRLWIQHQAGQGGERRTQYKSTNQSSYALHGALPPVPVACCLCSCLRAPSKAISLPLRCAPDSFRSLAAAPIGPSRPPAGLPELQLCVAGLRGDPSGRPSAVWPCSPGGLRGPARQAPCPPPVRWQNRRRTCRRHPLPCMRITWRFDVTCSTIVHARLDHARLCPAGQLHATASAQRPAPLPPLAANPLGSRA